MTPEAIRLISWNVKQDPAILRSVVDEPGDVDVALLQEMPFDPEFAARRRPASPASVDDWFTGGWEKRPWRTAVVGVSDRVDVRPIAMRAIATPGDGDATIVGVSRPGTIAAAEVFVDGVFQFAVASVYAPWERTVGDRGTMWADGSAHRILSDLEPMLLRDRHLPLIVAGDWNILNRYGEHKSKLWAKRYAMVFDRAELLGLTFVGPTSGDGSRQADPWPDELPKDSTCVPTFRHSGQTPATATRQLDFVFATTTFADRLSVSARNAVDDWGPSDHCRVDITVDLR